MPLATTITDIVENILRRNEKPMRTRDIVKTGFQKGLLDSNDRNTVKKVNVAIYNSMRNGNNTIMKVEDHRYALTEWGLQPAESTSTRGTRHRRTSSESNLDSRVDERMREIQACISGIRLPSADRICLLIEFCYLLDLHQQAVDLHMRLNRSEVDTAWLQRVDTIVRTSKMKARK